MLKSEQLYIKGMTCRNCQARIEAVLNQSIGIKNVFVSYEKNIARFSYDTECITLAQIISQIENLGYQVSCEACSRKKEVFEVIWQIALIIILFWILQSSGILNRLSPSLLADSGMGYGMLFVIGLITSIHCIAMCGGIHLSQTLQCDTEKDKSKAMLKNTLSYNMGRVFSYTLIGGILGAVGGLAGLETGRWDSSFFQGSLKLIVGIIMVLMGINMAGIFPWHFRVRLSFLARFSKITKKTRMPFIVGIWNGLMPCGPLQSMQLVALASGNVVVGAASMFCFSMGTVPLMLGMGVAFSGLGKRFTRQVLKLGAILVVVLGLSMIAQGSALSGIGSKVESAFLKNQKNEENVEKTNQTIEKDGVQYVSSILESGKYPDITVKAGKPVVWDIKASKESINGCNYKILLQDFDMEYTFSEGENKIEFTPTKAGVYTYSCWMGMITGKIYVE